MTTQPQPDALRLADALLEPVVLDKHAMQAADELLRLHAECETLRQANVAFAARQAWWNDRMVALEAECQALRVERDALRAATGGRMGYFDDEVGKLRAECEALRAYAERGRWLVDWLEQTGLILAQFCQPAVGTRAEDWFVFWRPLCADGTSIPEGYAKTPEGAIDAARAAKEQA